MTAPSAEFASRHELEGSEAQSGNLRATGKRFADVFAGLGGFHVGLSRLGHECVFASEIDPVLQQIYTQNFGLKPAGDIRGLRAEDVPSHEILCAGFPCQPFSLAGKLEGPTCTEYGRLIDHVFRIVRAHKPEYVLLENVPNILAVADGRFWAGVERRLANLNYASDYRIYSPEQFGIPQRRNRLFVVASRKGLAHFRWPEASQDIRPLSQFVSGAVSGYRALEPRKVKVLNIWNRFVKRMDYITSDTVLAAEFGATYPIDCHPTKYRSWRTFKGAFGASLRECETWNDALPFLPHYAAPTMHGVAEWLRPFIRYSRKLYSADRRFSESWKRALIGVPNSWQKLEWRGDRRYRDIWMQTIQFRASGIRTMRPDFAPSLVAMTPTQTPIIGSERRYMMVREAAALQSLEGLLVFPENNERAFRALGNAVNALIVEKIAAGLIH